MFNFNKRLEKLKENSFRGINEKDAAGCTILHRAAQVSDPKVIKLLIEKGAKTNIENKSGETPLHLAAFYGKVENRLLSKFMYGAQNCELQQSN